MNMTKTAKILHRLVFMLATLIGLQVANAGLTFNPQGFNFGAIQAGVTSCHSVVLTNTSHTQSMTVTGWSFVSVSTELSITPAFSQSVQLSPGQSLTFEVCYTPNGNSEGMQNALVVTYVNAGHDTTSHSTHVGFSGSLHHDDHDTTHHNPHDTTDHNPHDSTDHDPHDSTDHNPHDSTDHDPHDSTDHNPHDSTDHNPHDSTNQHHCLGAHQGGNSIDPVVIGGSAEHTLYLINPTAFSITVTTATINGPDASAFAIVSTLPITVPPNSTNTALTYNFSAPAARNGAYTAEIVLTLSGDSLSCSTINGQLIGYPAVHHDDHGNNADSVVRPLFPEENRTLAIQGNGNHTSVTFYFTNNLTVDVTVNSIGLEDGTYFTISSTSPSTTPFVLQPGATMSVVVTYTATDNHVHQDHLVISASHAIQAISFDVQGAHSAPATVRGSLPEGVMILITPNPAREVLTVKATGIESAKIEVFDASGRTVMTSHITETWKWNASGLTEGYYLVRVEGESISGEKFIYSQKILHIK